MGEVAHARGQCFGAPRHHSATSHRPMHRRRCCVNRGSRVSEPRAWNSYRPLIGCARDRLSFPSLGTPLRRKAAGYSFRETVMGMDHFLDSRRMCGIFLYCTIHVYSFDSSLATNDYRLVTLCVCMCHQKPLLISREREFVRRDTR